MPCSLAALRIRGASLSCAQMLHLVLSFMNLYLANQLRYIGWLSDKFSWILISDLRAFIKINFNIKYVLKNVIFTDKKGSA
jgi:hypothetical protein